MADDKSRDEFTELLTRLVRVPKEEIDEQEQKYREAREESTEKRTPVVPAPTPQHH